MSDTEKRCISCSYFLYVGYEYECPKMGIVSIVTPYFNGIMKKGCRNWKQASDNFRSCLDCYYADHRDDNEVLCRFHRSFPRFHPKGMASRCKKFEPKPFTGAPPHTKTVRCIDCHYLTSDGFMYRCRQRNNTIGSMSLQVYCHDFEQAHETEKSCEFCELFDGRDQLNRCTVNAPKERSYSFAGRCQGYKEK